MKFTSKDLMKAMGLQVGNRIKVKGELYKLTNFEIIEDNSLIYLKSLVKDITFSISCLVNEEYEILPRPKRVGDELCKKCISKLGCRECPIQAICNGAWDNATLYKILQYWKESDSFDQEIYDLLKARLDKEVE